MIEIGMLKEESSNKSWLNYIHKISHSMLLVNLLYIHA
jgi:hypothetical protein